MANRGTRTAAFGQYGITLRNPIWNLSGRSEVHGTVAVSLWFHELVGRAGQLVYDRPNWGDWHPRGKRFLFADLEWARDHLNGMVNVVISVRAQDVASGRVHTADCYARPNLFMRITHLNPEIGAFRLEQVSPGVQRAA